LKNNFCFGEKIQNKSLTFLFEYEHEIQKNIFVHRKKAKNLFTRSLMTLKGESKESFLPILSKSKRATDNAKIAEIVSFLFFYFLWLNCFSFPDSNILTS